MPETAQDEVEIAGGAKVRVGDTVWWTPDEDDRECSGVAEFLDVKLTNSRDRSCIAGIATSKRAWLTTLKDLHPSRAAAIDHLIAVQNTIKLNAEEEIARLEALKAERPEAQTG